MTNEEKIVDIGVKMVNYGLTKGTWGNISLREGDLMWLTPTGIEYLNMKPEDVSVINLNTGEQISGLPPSSELFLHSIIYKKCPTINGIVHTHSMYATSFSAAHQDIPCTTEDHGEIIGGHIECPRYAPGGTEELGELIAEKLQYGKIFATLVANHGLVAVGRSLNEAYIVAEIGEKSAEIAYHAKSINPYFQPLTDEHIKSNRDYYLNSYSHKIVKG